VPLHGTFLRAVRPKLGPPQMAAQSLKLYRNSSGSFATLAAIRLAVDYMLPELLRKSKD
jgi:hypothetical protein